MSDEKKIPVSSKELYEAYKAWRDQDVEDGSPAAFRKREMGICIWVMNRVVDPAALAEMKAQFGSAGLRVCIPFEGSGSYSQQAQTGTQHLNPARVKWVDDRIADYEKANGL